MVLKRWRLLCKHLIANDSSQAVEVTGETRAENVERKVFV